MHLTTAGFFFHCTTAYHAKAHRRNALFFCLLLALLLAPHLFLPASADENADQAKTCEAGIGEAVPEEFRTLLEGLPSDVASLLPEEIFSTQSNDIANGIRKISGIRTLIGTVMDLVGLNLGDALRTLALLCGLLILSAVCSAVRSSLGKETVGEAFSFCSSLVILCSLLAKGYQGVEAVSSYFRSLNAFTAAAIPLLGVLYAVGGNAGAAAESAAGLECYMVAMEEIVGKSIVPFCGVCMALGLIGALNRNLHTSTLQSTVKKNYTTLLTFLMMLLIAMLSSQTLLAARGDSLSMKSAKFAAGNLIPVVGGSVSELLRTVTAGVGYLRGTFGICGVLLLLFLLLPTLVRLLLWRLVWQIGASVADLLCCDGEKKLLDEFASLYGYLIAAVCICSSVLLLALTLLTRCAAAY